MSIPSARDLPAAAGAYVLVIELVRPLAIETAMTGSAALPAGVYAYCGSARGPGGIRARIGRHLRRGKTPRWHIDRLTDAGRVVAVRAVPGGDECALLADLLGETGTTVPVPGFGSTDCRTCPAHLVALSRRSARAMSRLRQQGAGLP